MELPEPSVKEHILLTASRLFQYQGYNRTGINQIIDEAGVAKASLYYHFRSKEDLCASWLQRRNDSWFAHLEQHLRRTADAKHRIIGTFDYRIRHVRKNNFSGCSNIRIISEMPQRSKKIDSLVVAHKEKQRKFFIDLVRQLPAIERRAVQLLANRICLLFDGGTVQAQVYRDVRSLQVARRAVTELLQNY